MERQTLDAGGATVVPLCSCGWRGTPRITRSAAWGDAARHAETAHGTARHARNAQRMAVEREAHR